MEVSDPRSMRQPIATHQGRASSPLPNLLWTHQAWLFYTICKHDLVHLRKGYCSKRCLVGNGERQHAPPNQPVRIRPQHVLLDLAMPTKLQSPSPSSAQVSRDIGHKGRTASCQHQLIIFDLSAHQGSFLGEDTSHHKPIGTNEIQHDLWSTNEIQAHRYQPIHAT